MSWFDLLVKLAPPSALDRARQIAAEQREAAEEKRRRSALQAPAESRPGGKLVDKSIARRPIGVRTGGPFVIYAGVTNAGYRVVSTGGVFKDPTDVGGIEVLQDVSYTSGEDVVGVEDVAVSEWWYVGPGFPWRTRQVFRDRLYSETGGPFGEPCILRTGDPYFYEGEPLNPIPIDEWNGPAAGRIYYVASPSYTGWVIVPYVLTSESSENTPLTDGDISGSNIDVSKYFPIPAGDFTFEGWCRGKVRTGETMYEVGWTHVAVCRANNAYSMWVDGQSSIAPPMTVVEGESGGVGFSYGYVTLMGFEFYHREEQGFFRYSTYNTWDIGQVRITLNGALYSGPTIDVPQARWV